MSPTLDDWLLWVHVASAGVWLGSGVVLSLLARRSTRTGEPSLMIRQMEWIGPRVGGPVSLLIPITGVWIVMRSDAWDLSEPWILAGIGLFLILFAVGIGFHGPNYARIRASEAETGPDSEATLRLVRRSFAAARWEVVILVLVFWLMVFKP